ncbi:hypothetical protein Tco_0411768 [Tanacetum coccineum]
MAGPITNDYISATQKSFVSNDNDGKMIEKNFIEIEGSFLVKIRDNAFNGIDGENVFEHINSFLEVVEPLKFYNLFDHDEEEEAEDDDDPNMIDDVPEIFKIEDDLFNFDTPLMVRVGPMTYFQNRKWYDNLIDGCLKQETLMYKARIEGSWGDATHSVMKFCAWLKNSFENFHELDYDVLVKLEECWWKVNTDDNMPIHCWDNTGLGDHTQTQNLNDLWTLTLLLTANQKEEFVQEAIMDTNAQVLDDVVNVDEQPQADANPKPDNSIWFKQYVIVRQVTLDPEWYKEPNADDAPKQNRFNELVNVEKDPLTFDDLMGSTVDFTKFSKNRLKKDKITKAELSRNAATSYHEVYSRMKILSVIRITVDKQFGYGYLKVILVRRVDQDEYAFKEADFSRLYLNDIEDINYGITCEDEAKRRNSGTKKKTFKENCYLLLYAVSSKEDTAYQRQLITRIRVIINSRSGVSLFTYTLYAQLVSSQRYKVNVIDGN